MEDLIQSRYKLLTREESDSHDKGGLNASDYYELQVLKSLLDSEGNPNYDDLADYQNIISALSKVQLLVTSTVINYYVKLPEAQRKLTEEELEGILEWGEFIGMVKSHIKKSTIEMGIINTMEYFMDNPESGEIPGNILSMMLDEAREGAYEEEGHEYPFSYDDLQEFIEKYGFDKYLKD